MLRKLFTAGDLYAFIYIYGKPQHEKVLSEITNTFFFIFYFKLENTSIKVKRVFLTHLKNCTIVMHCFAIDHLPLLC